MKAHGMKAHSILRISSVLTIVSICSIFIICVSTVSVLPENMMPAKEFVMIHTSAGSLR